jgi:hypothetical protein
MTHEEIRQEINKKGLKEDERRRGFVLSRIDAIEEILLDKGLVTSGKLQKHLDQALIKNFQLDE